VQPPRFHLAIPVDDLDAAERFYGQTLQCARGRSAPAWIDWNLWGHQVVTHLVPGTPRVDVQPVDGRGVPVPHFGLLLTVEDFHQLAARLHHLGTAFVIEPYVRFEGQIGEQWTMFLRDPAGNALEFKAFANDDQVFAAEAGLDAQTEVAERARPAQTPH